MFERHFDAGSLWKSTHKQEDMRILRVGSKDRAWFVREIFEVLGSLYHRDGWDYNVPNTPCATVSKVVTWRIHPSRKDIPDYDPKVSLSIAL